MALTEKLHNIADAIRSKTNKSEEMTLEQMASEIENIQVEMDISAFSLGYWQNFLTWGNNSKWNNEFNL